MVIAVTVAGAGGVAEWGVAVFPSGAEFNLEIRVSDEERALGYMFRDSVGPRQGMLFMFDRPGRYGFWMKNCRVHLDLIWLDEELEPTVKIQPQNPRFRFTHRVSHINTPNPPIT